MASVKEVAGIVGATAVGVGIVACYVKQTCEIFGKNPKDQLTWGEFLGLKGLRDRVRSLRKRDGGSLIENR